MYFYNSFDNIFLNNTCNGGYFQATADTIALDKYGVASTPQNFVFSSNILVGVKTTIFMVSLTGVNNTIFNQISGNYFCDGSNTLTWNPAQQLWNTNVFIICGSAVGIVSLLTALTIISRKRRNHRRQAAKVANSGVVQI